MAKSNPDLSAYDLDEQIGYKLRLANQKHLEIFNRELPDVTATQFAVLARLRQVGQVSQNHLGRLVGLDAATTKGVVHRLSGKGFVRATPSQKDRRRLLISMTDEGQVFIGRAIVDAQLVSKKTTANLTSGEAALLSKMLDKL